ncbi:MBL fold metallo-hydrolase [Patescibacteria group bacterium]|nr:MBL fold metallo-hydrolase [Patescibacteria group bacterium]
MIITWHGHSCFKIQDKIGSDGIAIVTDPFDKSIGLKVPNFEADVVTVSHDHHDHNNIKTIRGNPFVINSPGEYGVKNIIIKGIDSFHDNKNGAERGKNVIYKITFDNITIAHLGDLGHVLDDKELEKLAGSDILLIPVGEVYTLDVSKAIEVISQIEPKIVIPMLYKISGLKVNVNSADKFIKELGIKPTNEDKLKINKKDLPQEDMELVVLVAQNA